MPLALCAPDKLRGSLDAADAAAALAEGSEAAGWEAIAHPLADGGEGTLALLVAADGGRFATVATSDALGRPIEGRIGLLRDGSAVVEAAEACGLARLAVAERDPLAATSAGVGTLVRAALDAGARRLVLCVGGSATVDGGLGFLRELGARLVGADGAELAGRGADMAHLARLDAAGLDPRLRESVLALALDVQSPLHGPEGAAYVFGPQKGASPADVAVLDAGLARVGAVLGPPAERPGAGAAGGLGAAFMYLGARPERGAELVMRQTGFHERLATAQLVLTAEGRIDDQTTAGKTVARVVAAAAASGVPCIAFGGTVEPGAAALYGLGARAVLGILRGPRTLAEAQAGARDDLVAAARAVCGLAAPLVQTR